MFTLVLAILSVESSYAQNLERPAVTVPDTVQFWLTPTVHWRVRTYAIDHDIHTYTIGSRSAGSRFTSDEASAQTTKHYGDIISFSSVLTFGDPNDKDEVQRVLSEHNLTGTLEVGESGIAFYNPDSGDYRTKSQPV